MTDLRITVKNTSPDGGTFLTPFYFGFHDGSFDLFDAGEAASPGLESLAEDGDFTTVTAERLAVAPDSQGLVVTGDAGPIATGEVTDAIVNVDGSVNTDVSFGAMVLPSNDAFIGTDAAATLFDANGDFLGEQTLIFTGADVYDAGTEVNTEEDAAFLNQTAPNTGITEGGVVRQHPGFNGSEGNPVGEGDQNILGGTNAFGEFIDPEAADFTREGAQIAVVHINTVVAHTGTENRDVIIGRADDDIVSAGGGRDLVLGGAGWDVLHGGAGDDRLFGGRGDDEIGGGSDTDFLRGGLGDDLFHFGSGYGNDTIGDFDRLGDDRIVLGVAGFDDLDDVLAVASETGRGTELAFSATDTLFLVGVGIDDLTDGDFIFA